MTRLLAAVMAALVAYGAAAEGLTGPVVRVHDGDTITVLVQNREVRIRLVGIDAPEFGQPFGEKSKLALSSLVFGKTVHVAGEGTDQYGRTLGRVFIGSDDINVAMVRAGMAWQYRYSRDKSIEAAQAEARTARRGLWADRNPVDPWEWRAMKKTRPK